MAKRASLECLCGTAKKMPCGETQKWGSKVALMVLLTATLQPSAGSQQGRFLGWLNCLISEFGTCGAERGGGVQGREGRGASFSEMLWQWYKHLLTETSGTCSLLTDSSMVILPLWLQATDLFCQ